MLTLAVSGKLVNQDPTEDVTTNLPTVCNDEKVHQPRTSKRSPPQKSFNESPDGVIPASWRWMTTESLCETIVDCPHSTPVFVESGIICLDTNSIKAGRLITHKIRYVSEETFAERVKRLVPRSGDVVFAREGSVGDSFIIPDGMSCCLGQRVMLFRPTAQIPAYFSLALSEPSSLRRLLDLHKGIGAKHVNVGDMRKAIIAVPPLTEQHRIIAKVEQLMELCDGIEAILRKTEDIRSRLLEAMLSETSALSAEEQPKRELEVG